MSARRSRQPECRWQRVRQDRWVRPHRLPRRPPSWPVHPAAAPCPYPGYPARLRRPRRTHPWRRIGAIHRYELREKKNCTLGKNNITIWYCGCPFIWWLLCLCARASLCDLKPWKVLWMYAGVVMFDMNGRKFHRFHVNLEYEILYTTCSGLGKIQGVNDLDTK